MKGTMMSKKIINIIFLIGAIFIAQLTFCSEAQALIVDATANSNGLFDNGILEGMHVMMIATYKTMGNVLMVGHSLMCYAINVDYTPVFGLIDWPNLGFWIVGAAIYTTGIFMALSVGIYFVDASLRLGFAIVFLPVSIALWPFPPTTKKFAENLSTIIRNAMLFVLMAIGISFAVSLIQAGLFEGGDQMFWEAISTKTTETISRNFSLFSSHILVVGFCLVFGFRTLETTVNNYLNSFFNDSMFGSSSPMNEMGTQAFGMVSQNVAKPALGLAQDIATHQAGNLISGIGSGLSAIDSPEGRQNIKGKLQTATRAILHPRQAYNNAMHAAGRKVNDSLQNLGSGANKAIVATGKGIQSGIDFVTAMVPISDEEDRQSLLQGQIKDGERTGKGINAWIDRKSKQFGNFAERNINKVTPAVGNFAEDALAHGGGAIRNAAQNKAAAAGKGVQQMAATAVEGTKQRISSGIASVVNEVQELRGQEGNVSAADIRQGLHNAKIIGEDAVEQFAETVKEGVDDYIVDPAKEHIIDPAKEHIVDPLAQKAHQFSGAVRNSRTGRLATRAGQAAVQYATEFRDGVKEGIRAEMAVPVTLNQSQAVSTAFQPLEHPIKSVKQVKELLKGKSADEKARIIIKNSGKSGARMVLRTLIDSKQNAYGAVGTLGKTLQDFGGWLGDNRSHGHKQKMSWMQQWNALQEQKNEDEQAKAEAREIDREYDVGQS